MSPVFTEQDVAFMQHALMLAQNAERLGEVPVGAVLVRDGEIIGQIGRASCRERV